MDFEVAIGYGTDKPDFWIGRQPDEGPASGPNREIHVAFQAADAAAVRAFFEAATELGAEVLHEPRHCARSTTTTTTAPSSATPTATTSRRSATRCRPAARAADAQSPVERQGRAAERGDVVGRGVGGLGGVGEDAEVRRRRQPALVGVEHVGPDDELAGQGGDPHLGLAVEPEVGGLPAVQRRLVLAGDVVDRDEDLLERVLRRSWRARRPSRAPRRRRSAASPPASRSSAAGSAGTARPCGRGRGWSRRRRRASRAGD